jgi:hypothetical protein
VGVVIKRKSKVSIPGTSPVPPNGSRPTLGSDVQYRSSTKELVRIRSLASGTMGLFRQTMVAHVQKQKQVKPIA